MLKLAFMGSDPIALPALEWMAGEGSGLIRLVAVFTQPDRETGRGMKTQPNAIKQWALARGLPVFQPERLGPEEQVQLARAAPDLALVMAYGHLLRPDFINVPRLGTLNLHTSILPAYRGASPIQTAICNGEKTTGVTLMRIVPELDAGPVAGVERVEIGLWDTALEVEGKLARAAVPLLAGLLPAIAAGTQNFVEQTASHVSFCRRLDKRDGVLDFGQPAQVLAARINGLMPWPGCVVEINGQPIKLGLADVFPGKVGHAAEAVPGAVLGRDGEGLLVGTAKGTLRLRKLQRPGGKMLPADEFLRGFAVADGTILASCPMPALVAAVPFPRRRV